MALQRWGQRLERRGHKPRSSGSFRKLEGPERFSPRGSEGRLHSLAHTQFQASCSGTCFKPLGVRPLAAAGGSPSPKLPSVRRPSHSSLLCASAPTPPPLRTPTHSFSDPQRSLLLPPSTQPRWHFQPQPTSPSPICPFYPVGGEKPCLGEHPQALLRESQVYCPTGARGGTRGKEKWDHADRSHL